MSHSSLPEMPEHPDVLLTIFHAVEDLRHTPMTREEVVSLTRKCDPSLDAEQLFRHWMELGHLRQRRGRFYVLRELAHEIESRGITPTLGRFERDGWILENISVVW
ncbi:hypothetical protein HY631_03340 [Candidatus Uhrbacteria bacterium]|nr:hypothetical protein [Candidatus Uhrbacteria bacterium]